MIRINSNVDLDDLWLAIVNHYTKDDNPDHDGLTDFVLQLGIDFTIEYEYLLLKKIFNVFIKTHQFLEENDNPELFKIIQKIEELDVLLKENYFK